MMYGRRSSASAPRILIFVGIVVSIVSLLGYNLFIAPVRGTVINQGQKLVQKTVDVNTLFHNYEWFYDQYQDILGARDKVKITYAMMQDVTTPEDQVLINKVNYQGQMNFLINLVHDYNSRSSQWNRTIAKSKDLPYKIKVEFEKGSPKLSEAEDTLN